MEEGLVLILQIEALAKNLQQAKAALDSPIFKVEAIASKLRNAVRNRFEWQLNNMAKELTALQKQVNNTSLDKCWDSLRKIRRKCKDLFRECLAFVEGALVRGAGLDNHLCLVADAFIDDLSERADISWGRFTIMATDEFFTQITEIIRLRFPDFDILQLPVAAHELGHFIGEKVRKEMDPDPFRVILEKEETPLKEFHQEFRFLHEQFADLFAVFALGPAYACTCIMRNFDPVKAHQDKVEHPADGKRVYFILRAMEALDQDVTKPYLGIRNYLQNLWEQNIKAVETPWPLVQKELERLDDRLQRLLEVMHFRLNNVRYKSWHLASVLADEMLLGGVKTQNLQLPDILNAAWKCRLFEPDEYKRRNIGEQSLGLCLQVAGEKAGGE